MLPSGSNRRAFVILGACFFGETFIFGCAYSLGLFYTLFTGPFPDGGILVAWSVTLNTFCVFIFSPLCSLLVDRLGCSITMSVGCIVSTIGLLSTAFFANSPLALCGTYGLLTGSGWGIGFSVTLKTLIGAHFLRFRRLAFCISGCGCGLGTFIFPPLVEALESRFGWRGVLLLLGGANLNLLAVAAVAKAPDFEKDQELIVKESSKTQSPSFCSILVLILKDYHFVLYTINVFLVSMAASVVNTHLPGFAQSKGVTKTLGATFLLSILGIASMFGRLICGFVVLKAPAIHVYYFATLGLGILTAPAFLFPSYGAMVVFSVVFGLLYSSSCLLPELVVLLRGLEQLNVGYAMVELMRGSGMLLGGPFGEVLIVMSGNFGPTFVTAGVAAIVGALGMTVTLCQRKGISTEIAGEEFQI